MKEKSYLVYAHFFGGLLSYIGKGSERRAFSNEKRNAQWVFMRKMYGEPNVIIINEFKIESDAYRFEGTLIKLLKPHCNIMQNTFKHSDEAKKSIAHKIKMRPMSELTRKKISESRTGRKFPQKNKRIFTKEEIDKISSLTAIPILCINNGIKYKSSAEAGRCLGISYKLINRVANRQRKHTHGFVFEKLTN